MYMYRDLKSSLAPVWIREFWPKLCPAFVRTNFQSGAPGKKDTAERRHTVELCVLAMKSLAKLTNNY